MDCGEDGEGQVYVGATGEENPKLLAETQKEDKIGLYDAVLAKDSGWSLNNLCNRLICLMGS
jgi:hypothetical protein